MRTEDYLKTDRGQLHRRHYRQLATVFAQIPGEPRSKGSISDAEKRDFQAAVVEGLGSRCAFRGDVVLELDFAVKGPNPPAIQTLPKNYLDLLMRPVSESLMTRRKRLYSDDRQVKFLVVNYQLDHVTTPGIHLRARPMRHLLEDLRLLSKIRAGELNHERRRSYRARIDDTEDLWREEDDPSGDEPVAEQVDELRRHRANRELYSKQFSEEMWEAYDHHLRFQIQRAYLARSDRWLRSALLGYPQMARPEKTADPSLAEAFANLAHISRTLLLTGSISFAGLPRREGEGKQFKAAVRTELEAMRQRIPLLSPLETMLSITMFCVPPASGGIDLDNLARTYVVPAVHDVLRPPSTYARALEPLARRNPSQYQWLIADIERAKRMPPHSISRYTAIEVPRFAADSANGEVRIALGDGMNPTGVLFELEQALDDWEDRIAR